MRAVSRLLGFLVAGLLAGAAQAEPRADFAQLLKDHWAAYLAANPSYAAALGERPPAGAREALTLAAMDAQAAEAAGFRKRLAAIPKDSLTEDERVTAAILDRLLARQVEGNRYPARAMLFSNRQGFHSYSADLPQQLPLFSAADYEYYVARLEGFGAQSDEVLETTRAAVKGGYVLSCAVLTGVEPSVRKLVLPAEQSRFWAPMKARPAAISEPQWAVLQARARAAIGGGINPAYSRFADYLAKEYVPACTRAVGASARPMGRDYYAWRARQETTTDLTPDQIHALGLSEVARIRAEMETVAKTAGFPSREAFVQHLRTDPRYYARTPEELMQAAGYQAKRIDGWMPKLFGKLPRLPYTVREIPAEIAPGATTALYNIGSLPAGTPGVYYVNTTKLNERPLFELPALTIHEAVPGHHHQIALAQELDLPPLRRHAAVFMAFIEGWGLYSERLGIEMGMYDTPAKDMGRLSYEMWRATRLVVDTGLHWKGWSKEQAVRYMLDNTALSAANVDAEVNRYIADPGQALAYKVGELRIRALRAEAEAALGPAFDLRAFHDRVLEAGPLPLDLLEQRVRSWIVAQKAGLESRAPRG